MTQDYNTPAGRRAPVVFTVTAELPVGEVTLIILAETGVQKWIKFLLQTFNNG
jgi:hypothetical protein